MKKTFKYILSLIMAVTLICALSVTSFADELEDGTQSESEDAEQSINLDDSGWPVAPETLSGSVMMVEVNTGATLYSKDEETKRYPASTTKILTCLLALENCSLNETVVFSQNAVNLEDGSSSIDAVEGEEMSMKDCLYGLMLPSGNDCAIAIAEHVAGSVEAFAEMMNERAKEIGCENSNFVNPNGLYDSDHYTTAADLCKIAQVCFNNSAFVEIVSQATYVIPATNKSDSRAIENTNYMILDDSAYYNENIIGGKTGYLPEAGRCLVTLAKKDGLSVITVCLFSSVYTGVFTDTEELTDYIFNGFTMETISESESRFTYASNDAKVWLDSSAQVLLPKSVNISELDSEIIFTYDMDLDEFNEASAQAGITEKDGRHLYATIEYSYNGRYLGHLNVIINDNMNVAQASFSSAVYINIWWFVLFIFIFAAAAVFAAILINTAPARRRRRTKLIKTQTDDGEPIPINIKKTNGRVEIIQTSSLNGHIVREGDRKKKSKPKKT